MGKLRTIRFLFLTAIIILFCYRGAHLQQRDECYFTQSAPTDVEVQHMLIQVLSNTPHEDFHLTAKQAAQVHAEALKFNAHLALYLDRITSQAANDRIDDSILNQTERALIQLEKETRALGIYELINQDVIVEIRKKIAYLRAQPCYREKR
jgi:hypothetical protein